MIWYSISHPSSYLGLCSPGTEIQPSWKKKPAPFVYAARCFVEDMAAYLAEAFLEALQPVTRLPLLKRWMPKRFRSDVMALPPVPAVSFFLSFWRSWSQVQKEFLKMQDPTWLYAKIGSLFYHYICPHPYHHQPFETTPWLQCTCDLFHLFWLHASQVDACSEAAKLLLVSLTGSIFLVLRCLLGGVFRPTWAFFPVFFFSKKHRQGA